MPYANRTMKHAREVLAETARIVARDAEKKKRLDETPVNARAQAKPKAAAAQTATARWNSAVAAKTATGLSRAKAVRAVAIESPDLQAAYIAQFNQKYRQVEDLEREVSRLAAASR